MSCAGQILWSVLSLADTRGWTCVHEGRRCRSARERGTGTDLADCVIVWLVNRLGRVLLSLRRCHVCLCYSRSEVVSECELSERVEARAFLVFAVLGFRFAPAAG
jgi:hypothetical protein